MLITLDPAKVRQISRTKSMVRFAFGGLVAVPAGLIGTAYGPEVCGLFPEFSSISAASLPLIQRRDGKNAVGVDALGAAIGSVGCWALPR